MSNTTDKLANKIAVVTGASRGIGRASAKRLARDGALVAVHYNATPEGASSLVEELGDTRAFAVQGDLSSVAGIDTFFENLDAALKERTGDTKFDILMANAGVNNYGGIVETDEAAFDRLFDTNVKGVFFTVQRALSRMRDGGRIVTVSSGLTRFVFPGTTPYAATKGAVEAMTRHLAAELGPRKITVNTIAPGAIKTDMSAFLSTEEGAAMMSSLTALDRVGLAEDVADIVGFLASDDSRWITGERIEASGGHKL